MGLSPNRGGIQQPEGMEGVCSRDVLKTSKASILLHKSQGSRICLAASNCLSRVIQDAPWATVMMSLLLPDLVVCEAVVLVIGVVDCAGPGQGNMQAFLCHRAV